MSEGFKAPGEVGASGVVRASNRFGWDYRAKAAELGPPVRPIFDAHAHINGERACAIWREVAGLFGVTGVLTMVPLSSAQAVRGVLGEMARFIAFPNFRHADRARAMTEGFLSDIQEFKDRFGARVVKLWNAPRLRDLGPTEREFAEFDSPWRVRHARLADQLGMAIMVHVADPDTWFATRYKDAGVYGRKIDHYRGLRAMLDRFKGPWIAAHMGGWPEDLAFLSELLATHANLYLDCSATKWIVRAVSVHPRDVSREFFSRWKGRILFGSDIVTTDEHLAPKEQPSAHPMGDLADSPEAAFDLYASRYWAHRALWETLYEGESPIADPDLAMVDPGRFGPMDAPTLRGLGLPPDVLGAMYWDAAKGLGLI